jgi:U3 small nucleolar RNA-associated protein 14
MKEKRAEFLKLKALQSYQEAKFKRVKRIKSKRYRKILRKEKEKQDEKNLDRLEKEDPLQFKEVLEQIEKKRMKVT